MCIILFAYNCRPGHPLVLLANRDEFYERPASPAEFWKDFSEIYAGRDLVGGGTWLGVNRSGRFAAVTNYRDPRVQAGTVSRGNLTADFLKGQMPAEEYLTDVKKRASDFSGFNLLVGEMNTETNELYYFSNLENLIRKLAPGIYGLSNHLLDTPWPKVVKGKEQLRKLLKQVELEKEEFLKLLADDTLAADAELPDTGIGYEREKLLSSVFIKAPGYGTRCSTILTFDDEFKFDFEERTFV